MRFIAPAILFGLFSTAIAAPQPADHASHDSLHDAGGFYPGSLNSACYCCPVGVSDSGANCSPAKEGGRCINGDSLICCDAREQECENLGSVAVDGTTGGLNVGGLLNQVVSGLLGGKL